ncbi:MAG: nucleotide exchange factor GrpE [Chloroflexi bacterium]|nr:nucleotide exchange factor GrpE [Chloroflexota bacterium]
MQIPVRVTEPEDEDRRAAQPEPTPAAQEPTPAPERPAPAQEEVDWRDLALRLQAEMENFRKRQQRLAQEQIASDRERMLRGVLPVADNLERALAHSDARDGLRQGVALTRDLLMQWLRQQGVEPLDPTGKPFDPTWHEAVGTVPSADYGVEPQTVVAVSEVGYRLNDRLLRPAKVIVAV